jgi:hypothetical protein
MRGPWELCGHDAFTAVLLLVYAFLMCTPIFSGQNAIASLSSRNIGRGLTLAEYAQQATAADEKWSSTVKRDSDWRFPPSAIDSWRYSSSSCCCACNCGIAPTARSWSGFVVRSLSLLPRHEFLVIASSSLSSQMTPEIGYCIERRPSVLGCSAIHILAPREALQAAAELYASSNISV